jgi:hypothetical protein
MLSSPTIASILILTFKIYITIVFPRESNKMHVNFLYHTSLGNGSQESVSKFWQKLNQMHDRKYLIIDNPI